MDKSDSTAPTESSQDIGPDPSASKAMFTSDVITALTRREGGGIDGIPGLAAQYIASQKRIPGAPPIEQLLPIHTRAIIGTPSFSLNVDKTWVGYLARVQENEDFEQQANNPYFPRWFGKTEDDSSIWVQDTGQIDGLNQKKIDQIFWLWQRPTDDKAGKILSLPPTQNEAVLNTILDSCKHFMGTFLRPMGNDTGKNTEFRWSSTLPILCSFGFKGFRKLSAHIADYSDEEDFQHWQHADDEEIAKDLRKAVEISGYPINLGQVDCHDLMEALECTAIKQAPRWLPSLILIHVLKYVRFYQNLKGKKYLFAAYRGRGNFMELSDDGHFSPLGAHCNKSVSTMLQNILRLRIGSGKKKTPCELAVAGILNQIMPQQLPRPIEPRTRPDIIIAPGISIMQAIPNQQERKRKWIDPGIAIHNIGLFDAKTGKIDDRGAITDELAVSMKWPLSDATPADLCQWFSELPPQVTPFLPSQLIFEWIRNINPLGFPMGLRHIYNGILVANMIRPELVGTRIGGMLNKEFPAFWVLPMGSTMEQTTNQGKTTLCRVTANILAPGVEATVCTASTSPPAMRSSASQIEQFGTAIYDEFIPPKATEHFLHATGFVSMCTGGLINPGKAMENSEGFRLRFPLFLAAKGGPDDVQDVKNRSFMLFMDELDQNNRSAPDELAMIMSGSASAYVRLSTQLWIQKYDIVERVRELRPEQGVWRFDAHMAVIKLLAGDDFPEVAKYLKASWDQCDIQGEKAGGTLAAMGKKTFDFSHYLSSCELHVLEGLALTSQVHPVAIFEVIKKLVESGNNRDFFRELKDKAETEQTVINKFKKYLKRQPVTRTATQRTGALGETAITATYNLKLSPNSDDYVIVERK